MPSEDSDHTAYQCSLLRVFAEHSVDSQRYNVSSGGQRI